jgi:hypothetical protein
MLSGSGRLRANRPVGSFFQVEFIAFTTTNLEIYPNGGFACKN